MKEQNSKPDNTAGATPAPAAKTEGATSTKATKAENAAWHDPWIKTLCGGGNVYAETVLVAGYVGASSDEGHVRIFFDPHLSYAVDVPTAGIAHREEIPRNVSPLGGSYLWIARDSWDARKPYQLQQVCSKN